MTKKITNIIFLFFSVSACVIGQNTNERVLNFPKQINYVDSLPAKENVWVFILAGQSNMAGRGFVEPQDTIQDSFIITINKKNQWIYAKEPLHFYQPKLTGLDCGMSFASELKNHLNKDIVIAMIPCAVGGSSIEVWLNDSLFNGVHLNSNFKEKVKLAKKKGVLKGILWHQGEANAFEDKTEGYADSLRKLFRYFRETTENDSLPIILGELGAFPAVTDKVRKNCYFINEKIHDLCIEDKNCHLVHTEDLKFKKDNVHFNSESQRELGKRYAKVYLKTLDIEVYSDCIQKNKLD